MQAQMENAEDVLISRDQEIATLKTWVEQLAPKDAEIARLRARIEELDPFVERSRRLEREQEQERARASAALRGKEEELAAHQARLVEIDTALARVRTQSQEDLTRFGKTLEERDRKFSSYEPPSKSSTGSVEKSKKRTLPSAKRKSAESWMSASAKRKSEPSANDWSNIVRLSVLGHQQNPQGRSDRLRTARRPPGQSGGKVRPRQQDDLKQIHGIGPVMERVLNRMGMFTFRQIAEWKDQDVEHMASELNTFPDRIRHDNWIAGAKEQHFIKYGEEL